MPLLLQPREDLARELGRIADKRAARKEQRVGPPRARVLQRGQIVVEDAVHGPVGREDVPFLIDAGHREAVVARKACLVQKHPQGGENPSGVDAVGADQGAETVHAAATHGQDKLGALGGQRGDSCARRLTVVPRRRIGEGGGHFPHAQRLIRAAGTGEHLAARHAGAAAAARCGGGRHNFKGSVPAHRIFFPMGSGQHSPRSSQPSQSTAISGAIASHDSSPKPRAR